MTCQYAVRVVVLALAALGADRPGDWALVAAEPVFRAGAATADLTPEKGVSLDGPISKPGLVRGVHDPLTARALVLELKGTQAAIVICDMCGIDREVYDEAKALVRQRVGIPVEHQLLAATHSHATPRVMRISTQPADEAYRRLVAERIAQAVIAAHERLAPAIVGFGGFARPDMVACRRFLCAEGAVGPNPFGETGERVKSVAGVGERVIRPAGPVDPGFSVLSIRHADGRPLAVLGNFSVHYCGGYAAGMVSADYFGVYANRLAEKLAPGGASSHFVGLMSNGTSGDTGSFSLKGGPRPPWAAMDEVGQSLADETVALLDKIEHRAPAILKVAASELDLAVRKPTAERLAWAKKLLADPQEPGPHRWSRIYAQETLALAEYPERTRVPVMAIRVGQIGIAATSCEAFAETGLAIKAQSPLQHTFTIELAGGATGYLPTPEQHAWGGYETWAARSSRLEVQAEPKIRAELIRLLGETAKE